MIPTDRDERIAGFHGSAQKFVFEWAKKSKVTSETMDPLSCLCYGIVQKMEETYQEAVKEEKPAKRGFIPWRRK